MMRAKVSIQKIKKVLDGWQPETYLKFLEWSRNFYQYSFANRVLIFSQYPSATYVAGFRKWKKLGGSVKKGEHGIAIFVPFKKKKTDDEEDEDDVYFGTGYVFDISQVEIDKEKVPLLVKGLEGNEIWDEIKDIIPHKEKDIKVKGYFNPSTGEIVVSTKYSDVHKAKTLIHEYAHKITQNKGLNMSEWEVVAEGTAYTVMGRLGVDTGNYSEAYIAAWNKSIRKDVCLKEIEQAAKKIVGMLTKEKVGSGEK